MKTPHFVTFLSPGTLMSESTTKPIASWDVNEAQRIAAEITERYNARPFGFYFTTRTRREDDPDSHQSAKSPTYFLGGTVRTVDEVRAAKLPSERILLANMEGNGYKRVIQNDNSWRATLPLDDNDVVLPTPEWAVRA